MLAVAVLGSVFAAEFPNGSYTPDQVFQPLVVLDDSIMISDVPGSTTQPRGSNAVMVLDGYFVIMGSADSGNAGAVLHVLDVSTPTDPILVSYAADANLRELHSMPAVALDGGYLTVLPSIDGIQVWDLSSPEAGPAKLGEVALEGVAGGDYDNTAWQITVSWPYAFVGSSGAGVHIVDISDPSAPVPLSRITTGELGIGKAGPIYVAGNLIVVATMDTLPIGVGVVDVVDPMIPIPLGTGEGPPLQRTYSSLVLGSRIYGPGDLGVFHIATWEATDVDANIEFIAQAQFGGDKGGYCSFQDDYVFCGQSGNGFYKIDVSDEANPVAAGNGAFAVGDPDMDFATVLGNLVFVSNDHTGGPQGAFVPHQADPDVAPPEVVSAHPPPGSLHIPLATRFTVFFSDDIDLATVDASNFLVRSVSDGAVVPGVFARSSLNAISFSPDEELREDETYVITLRPDGMTDVAGNAIPDDVEVGRWSTGDTIDETPLDPPDPPPGDDTGTEGGGTEDGGADGSSGGAEDTGETPETPDRPTTGTGGESGSASDGEGGGCGCGAGEPSPPLWLALGGIWLAVRRRRR
jgi:MYXO-CTERM domain-containing protein